MNSLTIVVLAVFFMFALSGMRKGMVKKLAGIVSLVASAALVSAALPYITEFLKTETPVYEYIVYQCENVVGKQASASLALGGEGSQGESSIDREQIKTLMNQYGMDSSVVDGMSDAQLAGAGRTVFSGIYPSGRGSGHSAGYRRNGLHDKDSADEDDTESPHSALPERDDAQLQ